MNFVGIDCSSHAQFDRLDSASIYLEWKIMEIHHTVFFEVTQP